MTAPAAAPGLACPRGFEGEAAKLTETEREALALVTPQAGTPAAAMRALRLFERMGEHCPAAVMADPFGREPFALIRAADWLRLTRQLKAEQGEGTRGKERENRP
ncbi:MAG: hypothetical protein JXR96_26990 [Deltaproteobacteria bacterium]|nr:hypothetical protein [Deltaproteobacteria bacterium]